MENEQYMNPYHFVRQRLMGKWKMTILHHIHTYGTIRFNETRKTLPITEKVLSEQLRELAEDGLVERIQFNTMPLRVEYVLTDRGRELIPALDILYVWSIRRMYELGIPIDPDAFDVHFDETYTKDLSDIMSALHVDVESIQDHYRRIMESRGEVVGEPELP